MPPTALHIPFCELVSVGLRLTMHALNRESSLTFLRIGIHGFAESLGIDTDDIRFYWSLKGSSPETHQVAYRIIIITDQDAASLLLPSNDTNKLERAVCDSGIVTSTSQRNICITSPNAGAGFKSTTLHLYRIIVWDQDGCISYSPVQEFYTSYPRCSRLLPPYSMNQTYMPHSSLIFRTWFEDAPNRWKAVWIGDGGDKPTYLRKSIFPSDRHEEKEKKEVARVFAFASGLGHFNLTINGYRPEYHSRKHMLDPGWTT
ncbi:hypothetical protein KEM54_002458 [Ascosphaera aggregata]|nr:hypothetical protein KEM54_002458 [Ascosphaera aggregata]